MAAPSNKPIGYQVSVIVLSLLIVVLGTVVYMDQKNLKQLTAENLKNVTERQATDRLYKTTSDYLEDLKKLTGNPYDDYGLGDDQNVSKVKGACLADIAKATVLEPSYKAAINKLVQQAGDLEREREKLRSDLDNLQKTYLALQGEIRKEVEVQEKGREKAEGDLRVSIKGKDEEVRAKQKAIDELRQDVNTAATELENEKIARAAELKSRDAEIDKLTKINLKLNEQLDEITKTSFEVPDGEVRWVDNQNGRVWINLGEADNLPKRMTFSVYTKSHNGVARGSNDIKGAIEVTRIIDAHTAEARITKEDLYQPISRGDPIFTPIWSPGRRENFSFVGIIDLDGDGRSDRLKLHELVAAAGATIDNEVDDNGKRIRYIKFPNEFVEHGEGVPGIDVNTKFLVVGQIPDISLAGKDEDKERIERILKKLKELRGEAQQQGVRIVNLNDFLSWIGYQPQRRLYVPGSQQNFPLKAGTREPPVDKMSSQVSGAISGNKKLKPQSSSGQVSPLYGK